MDSRGGCPYKFLGGQDLRVKKKGKARSKDKEATQKCAEQSAPKTEESAAKKEKCPDAGEVREDISDMVRSSAHDIATEVIKVAKTGQLASAKYLFEAVGLYPATEATAPKEDNSLAHTLLRRMGLPTEPAIAEEEPTVLVDAKIRLNTEDAGDTEEFGGNRARGARTCD